MGVHPETFRRLVANINEFALISIRALPGVRSRGLERTQPRKVPMGLELTPIGEKTLLLIREARKVVRCYAHRLPAASFGHWLAE